VLTSAPELGAMESGVTAQNQEELQQTERQLRSFAEEAERSFDEATGESGSSNRDEELKKAANQMEGLLIHELIKQMRETIPENELTQGGHGGEVFREQLDQKYSELISESSNFGISEEIYKQFAGEYQ